MDFVDRRRRAGRTARCTTLSTTRRSRGPASRPPHSGRALVRWSAIWRRATRRCSTRAMSCNARSMRGTWSGAARPIEFAVYTEFLRGIGYLQAGAGGLRDRYRQGRSRDRQHRRPAARRAGNQCALCAECRERALGQPVRCAIRHRRHPRGWRRDARSWLQRDPRRPRHRQGPRRFSTRRRRSPSAAIAMRQAIRSTTVASRSR